MRVKICGITRPQDALAAEAAGADAVGFIFAEGSKRYVTPLRALEIGGALGPFIARVGVFVDAPLAYVFETARALRLTAVQLHGSEDATYAKALGQEVRVVRAVRFEPTTDPKTLLRFPADALMLDGLTSGARFDWQRASALRGLPQLILAGGLTPENVTSGIEALAPYGVDVASGVESSPGIKDPRKILDFVRAAKGC